MLIAGLIFVAGYYGFRSLFYAGDSSVFAQETILVMLGAVATIFLTAILLNRQTELELRKEGSVLLLEQKTTVYMAAIEKVADIVEGRHYDDDLIDELRVLNHKLSVVGSRDVIATFSLVLERLLDGLVQGALDEETAESVMHAVAGVTIAMRRDMLSGIDPEADVDITNVVLGNSKGVERLDDLGAPPPIPKSPGSPSE